MITKTIIHIFISFLLFVLLSVLSVASEANLIIDEGDAILSVKSQPEGATVDINNQYIGTTPLSKIPLVSGIYNVRVKLDNYKAIKETIELQSGEKRKFYITLHELPAIEIKEPSIKASWYRSDSFRTTFFFSAGVTCFILIVLLHNAV